VCVWIGRPTLGKWAVRVPLVPLVGGGPDGLATTAIPAGRGVAVMRTVGVPLPTVPVELAAVDMELAAS